MRHDAEKRYFEYLAKMILENYVPKLYSDLQPYDRPDLITKDGHGIEVTRAMFEGEGEANGVFKRIKGKSITSIDNKFILILHELGYEIHYFDDGYIWGISPEIGSIIDGREMKQAYIKKVEAVADYSGIDTLDLFIYTPMIDWYEENLARELMDWVSSAGTCPFQRILLFETEYLYLYDTAERSFKAIGVRSNNPASFEMCMKKAREYAISEQD